MKKLILSVALFAGVFSANAQIADGSVAPDFTATDQFGVTHTMSDYLAQGKTVILDVSATWCGPCWNYHNTEALGDMWKAFGPQGSNEIMIFYIEGDAATTTADLNGTGGNTQGDWVSNTLYPILDESTIADDYQITYFPTIYRICPDGFVFEINQMTPLQMKANINAECGTLTGVQDHVEMHEAEVMVCPTDGAPSLQFKNFGINSVMNASVVIKENGTVIATQPFTGNVAQFSMGTVNFPMTTFNGGSTYTGEVVLVNGNAPFVAPGYTNPFHPAFSEAGIAVQAITGAGTLLPYANSFTSTSFPYTNWALNNPDAGITWERVSTNSGSLKYDCFSYSATGQEDEFLIEPLDFSTGADASLVFNVAHARYNTTYSDELEVLVSTNCGGTWVSKWLKAGTALATAPTTTADFIPTASQWRTECIDMSEFLGQSKVHVKFKGTNGYGNNIYVDGLNFTNTTCSLGLGEGNFETFKVYPNPVSDVLNVSFEAINGDYVVTMLDLQGRVVATQNHTSLNGAQVLTIPVSEFAKGSYIVTISTNGISTSQNVIIK